MRKIKEIMRLMASCGLSDRAISHSCGIARSTVAEYLRRAGTAGLTWPLPDELDDSRLEALLFPLLPSLPSLPPGLRPQPDWAFKQDSAIAS